MKCFLVLVLALVTLISCVSPPLSPTPVPLMTPPLATLNNTDAARQIDRYLTRLANRQEFSGAVLVARKGEPILRKGYGPADAEKQIPNSTETRFQIASVGKTLTASAIMMLAQRGGWNSKRQFLNTSPTPPLHGTRSQFEICWRTHRAFLIIFLLTNLTVK